MNPYTVEGSSQLELPLGYIQIPSDVKVLPEVTGVPSSYPVGGEKALTADEIMKKPFIGKNAPKYAPLSIDD